MRETVCRSIVFIENNCDPPRQDSGSCLMCKLVWIPCSLLLSPTPGIADRQQAQRAVKPYSRFPWNASVPNPQNFETVTYHTYITSTSNPLRREPAEFAVDKASR